MALVYSTHRQGRAPLDSGATSTSSGRWCCFGSPCCLSRAARAGCRSTLNSSTTSLTLGLKRQSRLRTAWSEGGTRRTRQGLSPMPIAASAGGDGLAQMPRARAHLLCQLARRLLGKGGDSLPRSFTDAQLSINQVAADFVVGQHRGASAARPGFQRHQLLQVFAMSAQTRAMPQPGLSYRSCKDTFRCCGASEPSEPRFQSCHRYWLVARRPSAQPVDRRPRRRLRGARVFVWEPSGAQPAWGGSGAGHAARLRQA